MNKDSSVDSQDLPKWLWLWFPPLIFIPHAITRSMDQETHGYWMKGETSFIELGTFSFLVIAVLFGICILISRARVREWYFKPWVLMLCLGCVYFAGEEVSWGHHWGFHPFGEEVTQSLIAGNDQDEPNLHNQGGLIGSLLDQWPRAMLSLAALVGGILVPLLSRYRRRIRWPNDWIWPTMVCLPTSLFAVTVTVPSKVKDAIVGEEHSFGGWGETKEYLLAFFLMLYCCSLFFRLRRGVIADQVGGTGTAGNLRDMDSAGPGFSRGSGDQQFSRSQAGS